MSESEEESDILRHFVDAQDQHAAGSDDPDRTVYERALDQLKSGVVPAYEELWFIFPRVTDADEARRRLAKQFSIKSYKEAKAYYFDNVLYKNLTDAIHAVRVAAGSDSDLDAGFGRGARKFKPWLKESLTLFREIEMDFNEPNENVFKDTLADFFGDQADEDTIDMVYDFADHPEKVSEFGATTSFDEDEEEPEDDLVDPKEVDDLEIEEPEYAIKGFLASRVDNGVLQYQADWDWRVPDLTFYPATNFRNASPLLKEFHAHHPEQPGPSVRVGEWLAAYNNGGIAESHEDDNTPMVHTNSSFTASGASAAKKPNRVTKIKKEKKK